MEDESTRAMPAAELHQNDPGDTEPPQAGQPEQPESGKSSLRWLIIGGVGCLGLFITCIVIAGIAVVLGDDDDEAAAATPTADVAAVVTEEPTEVPTATPHPSPTPEPTATPAPSPTPEPTETPEPSPTPEPTATPAPTSTPEPSPTPTPSGPALAFANGTHIVGEDIEPGLYFANNPSGSCYWERLSGFSGELDDVIANHFGGERQITMIDAGDVAFSSSGCGRWERDAPLARDNPAANLDDGIFLVGEEVAPGAWRSEGSDGSCYWARLSNFSGELHGIISNSFGGVGDVVQINPGDAGFESTQCAPWVRIGD